MKGKIKNIVSAILCIAMLVGMVPLNSYAAEPSSMAVLYTEGIFHEAQTRQVLKLVNAERAKAGVKPLVMTEVQEEMAEQRASELTALFDHVRPDGSEYFSILDEYELQCGGKGENIAAGQEDAAEVMDSWMNSEDGHRENILNPEFTHIGIGCFEYWGIKFWVQFFTTDPSDTKTAATTGEDYVEAGVAYALDTNVVEDCSIEFLEPEIDLALGAKAEFDLCCYDYYGDFLGVVLSPFLDTENGGMTIAKNLVTVDEEGYINAVGKGTPGTETITVKLGNLTATKTIHVFCNHNWSGWNIITDATWDEDGLKKRTCSRCDKVEEQVIPKLSQTTKGWVRIDGSWYYYEDGKAVTGWKKVGSAWYYMYEDGKMASNTWIGEYYVDASGAWVENIRPAKWVQNSTGWWYRNENGSYPANCWKQIDGAWYYFNKGGYRVTGWQSIGQLWYYFDKETGIMQTGWLHLGKNHYYLNGSGQMQTGWLSQNGNRYYLLAESGLRAAGWQSIGGVWYYFDSNDGSMYADRWLNNKYYLSSNGAMAKGWKQIDGAWYYFDQSGCRVSGWKHIGSDLYYFDEETGIMQTGWLTLEFGLTYYLNASGQLKTGWLLQDGKWYYLLPDNILRGLRVTGWKYIGSDWYYFDPQDGTMYVNTWVDGYYVGSSGARVTK